MHPIVIMSYDKSPAISKAVAILQEAGMEVCVLNTATAKLKDFLGALAGQGDEPEDEVQSDDQPADPPAEDPEPVPKPTAAPSVPVKNSAVKNQPVATEALVNGEKVLVELVEGDTITLHSSKFVSGLKTTYQLNESTFSFWPAQDSAEVSCTIDLILLDEQHHVDVQFSKVIMDPPVIKVGHIWLQNQLFKN